MMVSVKDMQMINIIVPYKELVKSKSYYGNKIHNLFFQFKYTTYINNNTYQSYSDCTQNLRVS